MYFLGTCRISPVRQRLHRLADQRADSRLQFRDRRCERRPFGYELTDPSSPGSLHVTEHGFREKVIRLGESDGSRGASCCSGEHRTAPGSSIFGCAKQAPETAVVAGPRPTPTPRLQCPRVLENALSFSAPALWAAHCSLAAEPEHPAGKAKPCLDVHDIRAGKRLLVVAHGNSLRALVKHLDGNSDEEIPGLNIPTGIPLVYQLDQSLAAVDRRYLGDPEATIAAAEAVAKKAG